MIAAPSCNNQPLLNLQAQDHPQLFQFAEFLGSARNQAWLVGGTVRDLLSGRTPADYDIAFSGDLSTQIRAWCRQQNASCFWLDEQRNQSRALLDEGVLQFDFAPLRAATIEDDLHRRDYTLNAIAVPLSALSAGRLIDPLGGGADLHAGRLRSCSEDVLKDDPLRCLKGIRHHAQHGWHFTQQTLAQLRKAAPLLKYVAAERLRSELCHILAAPHLLSAVQLMEETGLNLVLFPTFQEHTFRTAYPPFDKRLKQLTALEPLRIELKKEYEALLPLRSLLLLALIYACSADFKPLWAERLRLSRKSRNLLDAVLGAGPATRDFAVRDSPRVSALKVERLGPAPVARLLFTLLRYHGRERDALSAAAAIAHYAAQLKQGRVPALLSGERLARLSPGLSGQELGSWLEHLKSAEIHGEISTATEAEIWLKRQFSD